MRIMGHSRSIWTRAVWLLTLDTVTIRLSNPVLAPRLTLIDALRQFRRSYYQLQSKPSTAGLYWSDLNTFDRWYCAVFDDVLFLDQVSVDLIERYKRWCRYRVKRSTFNRRRAALKRFCDWAVVAGLMQKNPVDGVRCAKW